MKNSFDHHMQIGKDVHHSQYRFIDKTRRVMGQFEINLFSIQFNLFFVVLYFLTR